MVEIKALRKTFNQGRIDEVVAIQHLDLSIPAGEFLVVVGANGSGKSTLLNLIAGSEFPDGGEIQVDGNRITGLPEHRRSRWIARVFQNPLSGTAADLTVVENFRLASLRTHSKGLTIGIDSRFKNKVREHIASLGMGLENKLDQPMGTLSGGQRQALTLLMSVMNEAKLLLLDEPTAALDPRSSEIVMQTADKLIKEHSLSAILITHNLKEALSYGNRIIQMGEGRLLKDLSRNMKAELTPLDLYEWFI